MKFTTQHIGHLTWQVIKTELPIIDESVMTIDEKIDYRHTCRLGKDFATSDRLRIELEKEFVFINDFKDGTQEVYYFTNKFPKKMQVANEKDVIRQVVAKFEILDLSKYDEEMQKPEVMEFAKSIKPKFTTLRGYFDYLLKEDRLAESYLKSWLDRMNDQLKTDRENRS